VSAPFCLENVLPAGECASLAAQAIEALSSLEVEGSAR
jgi:hypothetical protein